MNQPSRFAEIPVNRSDRWALLCDVTAQWYPPIESQDGVSLDELDAAETRMSMSLPAALREWYALSGWRQDIWSSQDNLLLPNEFRVNSEHIVFLTENQEVVEWGISIADHQMEDPPVYVTSVDDSNVWFKENESISEFALQMFAFGLKWSKKVRWWANAHVTFNVLECILSHYPRLAFAEWHWPAPTRFYGYRDIIIEVDGEHANNDTWIYVVTRTESAVQAFKSVAEPLNIEWNACSDDWPPGWVNAVL